MRTSRRAWIATLLSVVAAGGCGGSSTKTESFDFTPTDVTEFDEMKKNMHKTIEKDYKPGHSSKSPTK